MCMDVAHKKHMSESFRLAALLALVGGFLEHILTYVEEKFSQMLKQEI